jgi:hypothetical protein
MQKFLNLITKRKQSTARVDALPDGMAVAALDRRFTHLLDLQALQPAPGQRSFAPLINPLEEAV